MAQLTITSIREAEYEVIGWINLGDDAIIVQTGNGHRHLNWLFDLRLNKDRTMLRKALSDGKTHHDTPIIALLQAANGRLFPPSQHYKSY